MPLEHGGHWCPVSKVVLQGCGFALFLPGYTVNLGGGNSGKLLAVELERLDLCQEVACFLNQNLMICPDPVC